MTDETAVVLASGGMDSATAISEAKDQGYDVRLLHVTYGQRTELKEAECAEEQSSYFDALDYLELSTQHLRIIGNSSLTDESMEVEDADLESEEVPSSYVPFRNANLLSMATSYAEANGDDAIFIGAHSEDFSGYPDCRPSFFETFQGAIDAGTKMGTNITLNVPFVNNSKMDILERGLDLGTPYELTWSCYKHSIEACGVCDACAYRLQAFERLGEKDPIKYQRRPDYVA